MINDCYANRHSHIPEAPGQLAVVVLPRRLHILLANKGSRHSASFQDMTYMEACSQANGQIKTQFPQNTIPKSYKQLCRFIYIVHISEHSKHHKDSFQFQTNCLSFCKREHLCLSMPKWCSIT